LSVRYYDWIAHFASRTPDKIAAIDLASDRRLSYAQFDARISRPCHPSARQLGVTRGDRVAVLALNTKPIRSKCSFACGRIGAVFLPLNTRLTVPNCIHVGDSSPRVMIHGSLILPRPHSRSQDLQCFVRAAARRLMVPTKPR